MISPKGRLQTALQGRPHVQRPVQKPAPPMGKVVIENLKKIIKNQKSKTQKDLIKERNIINQINVGEIPNNNYLK